MAYIEGAFFILSNQNFSLQNCLKTPQIMHFVRAFTRANNESGLYPERAVFAINVLIYTELLLCVTEIHFLLVRK